MKRLSIGEYQRVAFPALPVGVARALHATGAVRVSGTLGGTRTILQARSVVGATRVGAGASTVELQIRPKIGISRLLWLLGYARDQTGWRDEDVEISTEAGIVTAMAGMLTTRVRRSLATGILRGYQDRDETLTGLRGRLREADQMRVRPGLPLPVEVRYSDYTIDIPENRLLRSAIHRLLVLDSVPLHQRMALRTLDRELTDATLLTPGSRPPEIVSTRLNRHYAPALQLAQLIMQRTSVEHGTGPTAATGFLFDMNHVYEDWLTHALTTALQAHGGRVRRQQPLTLDTNSRIRMRTDITWWSANNCLAVIDAKYKRLPPTGPKPEDLYQILAYCTALGLSTGHLIYAAGSPSTPLTIRNSGIRIHTHVVPLADTSALILRGVANIATRIADR